MAWYQAPTLNASAKSATDFQLWNFLRQFPDAIRERGAYAGGGYVWPAVADQKFCGYIDTLVDNEDGTLTLTLKDALPIPDANSDSVPDFSSTDCTMWNGQHMTGCTGCFWVDRDCASSPFVPHFYDVVIDAKEGGSDLYLEGKSSGIRGQIILNTNNTLTITDDALNHITAKVITSLTDLNNARFCVVKRNGLWWSGRDANLSRWIEWPNDAEAWVGNVTEGSMRDDTHGHLKSVTNIADNSETNWPVDRWTSSKDPKGWAYEALVWGDDGYLWRVPIVGNDKNTLYFGEHQPDDADADSSSSSSSAGSEGAYVTFEGEFTIVKKDSVGFPDRKEGWHKWWYGGVHTGEETLTDASGSGGTYVHMDNDDVIPDGPWQWNVAQNRSFAEAAFTYQFAGEPPIPDCFDDAYTVHVSPLDEDTYAAFDNYCSPKDHYFAPHLHKTLRGWQRDIEGLITGGTWVIPVDYSGTTSIPVGTLARFFYYCSINAGTTVAYADAPLSSESSDNPPDCYFDVPADYWGATIYWTVVGTDGGNYQSDSGVADNTDGSVHLGRDENFEDATVIWTALWSRRHPLEFRFMYDSTFFVPDGLPGDDGISAIDPPNVVDYCGEDDDPPAEICTKSCTGVGYWTSRAKSTNSKQFSAYGYATDDADDARSPSGPFVNGALYRYVGVGMQDGTYADGHAYTAAFDDTNYELPYWDHAYEGTHDEAKQKHVRLDLVGRQSAVEADEDTHGTVTSLTDTTKNWWEFWYSGGTLVTHSGNAVEGDDISLTTEDFVGSNSGDVADAEVCWFGMDRFRYETETPFEGFVLEVKKTEQQVAEGGEPIYLGDGSDTVVGTYNAGDYMEDENGDPIIIDAWYKRVITSVDDNEDGTYTINFEAYDDADPQPSSASSSGTGFTVDADDEWRIREPKYNLNRWKDHRVLLTFPDGSKKYKTVVANDSNTIWWANSEKLDEPVPTGTRYELIHYETGGVWRYTTTNPDPMNTGVDANGKVLVYQKVAASGWFVKPTGVDARTPGPTFHDNMNENEPWQSAKKFGRACKGDWIWQDDAAGLGTFLEMYKILNAIHHRRLSATWVSRAVDATPENNACQITNYPGGFACDFFFSGPSCLTTPNDIRTMSGIWTAFKNGNAAVNLEDWFGYDCGEESGLPPQSISTINACDSFNETLDTSADFSCSGLCESSKIDGEGTGVYGYLKVDGLTTLIPSGIDYYNFGAIDDSATDEDTTTTVTAISTSPACVTKTGLTTQNITTVDMTKFDAQGFLVADHKWTKFDSSGDASTASRRSSKFGGISYPELSATPSVSTPMSSFFATLGYAVIDECVIAKYAFKYLSA